jgi:hypothetical protein
VNKADFDAYMDEALERTSLQHTPGEIKPPLDDMDFTKRHVMKAKGIKEATATIWIDRMVVKGECSFKGRARRANADGFFRNTIPVWTLTPPGRKR